MFVKYLTICSVACITFVVMLSVIFIFNSLISFYNDTSKEESKDD